MNEKLQKILDNAMKELREEDKKKFKELNELVDSLVCESNTEKRYELGLQIKRLTRKIRKFPF